MTGLMHKLGMMRLLLLGLVILSLPMAAFANAEPVGWGVIGAYVAPPLTVILFFVLLLDALMNRVFAIDLEGSELAVARTRIRIDLLGVLAILLAWGPFYYNLLQS